MFDCSSNFRARSMTEATCDARDSRGPVPHFRTFALSIGDNREGANGVAFYEQRHADVVFKLQGSSQFEMAIAFGRAP